MKKFSLDILLPFPNSNDLDNRDPYSVQGRFGVSEQIQVNFIPPFQTELLFKT